MPRWHPDLTLNVTTRVKVKVNAAIAGRGARSISRAEMSVTEVMVDGVAGGSAAGRKHAAESGARRQQSGAGSAGRAAARGARIRVRVPPLRQSDPRSGRPCVLRELARQLVSGRRAPILQLRADLPLSEGTGPGERRRHGGGPHGGRDAQSVRRRTSAPVRIAAFNLGDYEHAKVERGGYVVDVCANRKLEPALQPRNPAMALPTPFPPVGGISRRRTDPLDAVPPLEQRIPNPIEHLQAFAGEVASAMEFMASRFGPPALPHLTVSPIPGTFGQGFPGLIYLSTLAYLKSVPGTRIGGAGATSEMFFQDVLQAHEIAHQWWGNRVTPATYRDNWLMEALANYSALLYLEKRRGTHSVESMLDSYRDTAAGEERSGPGGGFGGAHRSGNAAGDVAGTARLALHHVRQGKLDHADAAQPDGRSALPGAAGRDQQALRPEGHHHGRIPAAGRRVSAAEIRRSEIGELLRAVGVRHGHSVTQAELES